MYLHVYMWFYLQEKIGSKYIIWTCICVREKKTERGWRGRGIGNILGEQRWKILNRILVSKHSNMWRRYSTWSSGSHSGMQRLLTVCLSTNTVHRISIIEDISYMITSKNVETKLYEIQHLFLKMYTKRLTLAYLTDACISHLSQHYSQ